MAVYTASYFDSSTHHGKLVPISIGVPKGHEKKLDMDNPLRDLLAPERDLHLWWESEKSEHKNQRLSFPTQKHIDTYTQKYREGLKGKLSEIKAYLDKLNPDEDETWLCWERRTEGQLFFCHRELAIKLVQKFRPDCYGECDVPNFKLEKPEAEAPQPEVVVTTDSDDLQSLIQWYQSKPNLPRPPFFLKPAVVVIGDEFYSVLEREILAATAALEGRTDKPHPRQKSGGLEADLRALKKIVDDQVSVG